MSSQSSQDVQDCAVCLQKCHYPTQLPCGHVFCFLCVKGVAIQSKKCAMCRAEIPRDYLDNPVLLGKVLPEQASEQQSDAYQWFYKGSNGWWKYDESSNSELEAAFNAGETACKLLLAGALYCIDFQNMVQVKCRDPTRRRRVRRDTPTLPAKGIAGIKIAESEQSKNDSPSNNENQGDDVIEIVDDDAPVVNDDDMGDVLQRISSLDLQEENRNESNTSSS